MDFSHYLSQILENFSKSEDTMVDRYNATMLFEEKFEFKWLATKLKMFSFVACSPEISGQDVSLYSDACLLKSLNNYKGLPRGFQNGVVSFSVLASEKVDEEAIIFSKSRPKKHFAAFEMPVVYDLQKEKIYYYEETPMWGAIYYKYFRDYIEKNFNANL